MVDSSAAEMEQESQRFERRLVKERKRKALEEKLARQEDELAEVEAARKARKAQRSKAEAEEKAAKVAARWAKRTSTLLIDMDDKINEYEDEDPEERISLLLRKPSSVQSESNIITFASDW